jgi:fructose/tagatose bisphosphate aldolase
VAKKDTIVQLIRESASGVISASHPIRPGREATKNRLGQLWMTMNGLRNILHHLQQQGAALGHFNVADLVLKAVVAAGVEVKVPGLIGASEGERDFLGTYELAALVKIVRGENDTPIFLNADHTHSLARAVEAAKAGFDAVVIDFSSAPLRSERFSDEGNC